MKIRSENIEKSLGGKKILKGVSLEANSNQLIGVIGPNGSGKSTLLKCMYRVLEPDVGEIYVDQKKLKSLSTKASAKEIAVVTQHNGSQFDFTVEEVVHMGRHPHKKALEAENAEDYRIVAEALERVNMEAFRKRNFSSLSGGEQQRVILARALAQKTRCLILDEPTNHLDIKYQLQLLKLLKTLDMSVIIALHDLNLAMMYCDILYVMCDGEIVAYGEPLSILTESLIEKVYEVKAHIMKNPYTGKAYIAYE